MASVPAHFEFSGVLTCPPPPSSPVQPFTGHCLLPPEGSQHLTPPSLLSTYSSNQLRSRQIDQTLTYKPSVPPPLLLPPPPNNQTQDHIYLNPNKISEIHKLLPEIGVEIPQQMFKNYGS